MKSVTINNEILKKVLKRLKDIIDKRAALPILQNLMLKVSPNGIQAIACDLEVTSIASLQVDTIIVDEFSVLLPFDLLFKICSLSESADIEISTDEQTALIKAGSDKYELKSLENVTEFPKIPDLPTENRITISDGFVTWMNKALTTVSTDSLRPALTKVCIDVNGESLTLATTDANVLFTKSFNINSSTPGQLIVSPKVAKALLGIEEVEILWNDKHLAFRSDVITVFAQRGTDKYANYKAVIPAHKTNVEFNRESLIHALEKVSITASSTMVMNLELKAMIGAVRVVSLDADLGRNSSIDIGADYTGKCERIALKIDNMIRLLHQVPFETIGLAIAAENKAVLLRSDEDALYTGLIMPLLIQ